MGGTGLLLYRQRFPPSRSLGASRHELGADAVDEAKVIRKPQLLGDNALSYISGYLCGLARRTPFLEYTIYPGSVASRLGTIL